MSASTSNRVANSDGAQSDVGVEGNSRLTSATGLVLLAMLAVEGYTVLDVRGLITLHIFLGIMLIGPVLLKVASTTYRFARYYTGSPAYVRKGAPNLVLRVLGPVVTISSLAVLGTGLGLVAVHSRDSLLLTAHKATFVIWFAAMTVHVLGHIRGAAISGLRELRRSSPRQGLRLAALIVSIAVGVSGATVLISSASQWTQRGSQAADHER